LARASFKPAPNKLRTS